MDIDWKDGELIKAAIKSDKGGDYIIRYKGKTIQVNIKERRSL